MAHEEVKNPWCDSDTEWYRDTMYMGGVTSFSHTAIPKDKRCGRARKPLLAALALALLCLLGVVALFTVELEGSTWRHARVEVCRKMQFIDPSGKCEELLRPRPHIVFIVGSQVGHGDVDFSCADSTSCSTPFMASLAAAEGVIFSNYYGHSRSAPSRGALLTGRYAFHTGLRDLGPEAQASELPRGFLTLADHLKSADYATHALGRWLLGDGNWTATPLCRGFDSFFGVLGEDEGGFVLGESQDFGAEIVDQYLDAHGSFETTGDSEYSMALRSGSGFIETLTNMSIGIVHAHADVNDANKKQGTNAEDRLPIFLFLTLEAAVVARNPAAGRWYREAAAGAQRAQTARSIDTAVRRARSIDTAVRRVVAALRSHEDMWENTLLVFASDSGAAPQRGGGSNWPFRGGGGTLWEGGTHLPAMLAAGSKLQLPARPGRRINNLVHHTDWLLTLMHVAGAEYDECGERQRWTELSVAADRSSSDGVAAEQWRPVDGYDLWPALTQRPHTRSPTSGCSRASTGHGRSSNAAVSSPTSSEGAADNDGISRTCAQQLLGASSLADDANGEAAPWPRSDVVLGISMSDRQPSGIVDESGWKLLSSGQESSGLGGFPDGWCWPQHGEPNTTFWKRDLPTVVSRRGESVHHICARIMVDSPPPERTKGVRTSCTRFAQSQPVINDEAPGPTSASFDLCTDPLEEQPLEPEASSELAVARLEARLSCFKETSVTPATASEQTTGSSYRKSGRRRHRGSFDCHLPGGTTELVPVVVIPHEPANAASHRTNLKPAAKNSSHTYFILATCIGIAGICCLGLCWKKLVRDTRVWGESSSEELTVRQRFKRQVGNMMAPTGVDTMQNVYALQQMQDDCRSEYWS